jgi:plastocyanin
MTDTRPPEETETPAPDTTEPPGEVESAPPAEVTPPPAAQAPVGFWQRPYVERFLVPLVLPVVVVVAIVVYVLNVSRMFLSVHGHIPVVVGTVITVTILLGATLLSASPRLRPTSVVLITAGFLFTLSLGGWISLGASENKEGGETLLAADLQAKQAKDVTAAPGGALAFAPPEIDATTGIVKFNVAFAAAGHTFAMQDPSTLMAELKPPATETLPAVAYFGKPGDYEYLCTIPGHEAGGMKGVVHVTGDAVPLEQALSDAGNAPTAAG